MAKPTQQEAAGPALIEVGFEGPFSWAGVPDGPSVFDSPAAGEPGIYLWTIAFDDGFLVYYVGETGRNHAVRLLEHYREHAAAMYHVYSPLEFLQGRKVPLWPGRYEKENRKSLPECIAAYPHLNHAIHELTLGYRFFLAPLRCEARLRRRTEAAIADTLYSAPGVIGAFQDRGIRYDRRTSEEGPVECRIKCSARIHGVPDVLFV